MNVESCPRCRGTGRRHLVGADLPVGGAAVLRRVARGGLTEYDHVVVFLRDCDRRKDTDACREGLTLLIPNGRSIVDLAWPDVPPARRSALPNVVLWGVDLDPEKAKAACRTLVRIAYDRVLLWLGCRYGAPSYTVFEASTCETE